MITFDLRTYYKRVGTVQDRLEQIRLEAERFRYYDNLSKEEQEEFKALDRVVRREVADEIAASLQEMQQHL